MPWAALVVVLGCASGPSGYKVSGSVTYDGKPLSAGTISFEPDSSAGNTGGSAVVGIVDGKYDMEPGKKVSGGAYIVRILPPSLQSGSSVKDVVQFPVYQTNVDLPKQDTVKDFDVPAPK